MPTQTFFNLQQDKQHKIIDASIKEFSKYSFYDASINRIIKEGSISRGSFYQYFKNKEDLFIYILDLYKYKVFKSITNNIGTNKYDIFELLILMYDFISIEALNSEDKEFIITTISNMDMKLTHHLMDFLNVEDLNKEICHCNSMLNMDNLIISTKTDIMNLHDILISIMMNQFIILFKNIDNKENCREDLINKFNLIKYGVVKK